MLNTYAKNQWVVEYDRGLTAELYEQFGRSGKFVYSAWDWKDQHPELSAELARLNANFEVDPRWPMQLRSLMGIVGRGFGVVGFAFAGRLVSGPDVLGSGGQDDSFHMNAFEGPNPDVDSIEPAFSAYVDPLFAAESPVPLASVYLMGMLRFKTEMGDGHGANFEVHRPDHPSR